MNDKLTAWLVASFIVLTLIIAVAVIFIPSVSEAATVIGIVLGAYTSLLLGGGVGAAVTKQVRKSNQDDDRQDTRESR